MNEQQRVLNEIEIFLQKTANEGMNPTRFGKMSVKNPNLVFRLRAGMGVTTKTIDKIRHFIKTHKKGKPCQKQQLRTIPPHL